MKRSTVKLSRLEIMLIGVVGAIGLASGIADLLGARAFRLPPDDRGMFLCFIPFGIVMLWLAISELLRSDSETIEEDSFEIVEKDNANNEWNDIPF